MSEILGMPVYYSTMVERGKVFVAADPAYPIPGYVALIVTDWIEAKMLEFDHDLWWSETPAESARRVVREVLEHHGEWDLLEEYCDG